MSTLVWAKAGAAAAPGSVPPVGSASPVGSGASASGARGARILAVSTLTLAPRRAPNAAGAWCPSGSSAGVDPGLAGA